MDLSSLFNFNVASVGTLFARFGFMSIVTLLITFGTARLILWRSSKKEHKIGFKNWFKLSFMYGITAAILALGIIVIFIIRNNGLYYFAKEAFAWSFQCGYILLLPEIILLCTYIIVYFIIRSNIYKSI